MMLTADRVVLFCTIDYSEASIRRILNSYLETCP